MAYIGQRSVCLSLGIPTHKPPFFFYKDCSMSLSLSIGPLVSLIAGILILIMPRLLNFIVAIYLIVMGILGLMGMSSMKL